MMDTHAVVPLWRLADWPGWPDDWTAWSTLTSAMKPAMNENFWARLSPSNVATLPVLVTPDGTVRAWEGMRSTNEIGHGDRRFIYNPAMILLYEPIPGPVLIDPADMPGEWVEWVRREVFGG